MVRRLVIVRLAVRAAAAAALLAALAVAAGYAWLGSSHALEWATRQAMQMSAGRLVLEGVEGSLRDEVRVNRLGLKTGGHAFEARALVLHWQPLALLRGELHVGKAVVGHLRHTTDADAPSAPPEPLALPQQLALPLQVVFADVEITRLELDNGHAIDQLRLGFSGARDGHRLELVGMQAAGWRISGELRVATASPFAASGKLRASGEVQKEAAEVAATIGGSLEALRIDIAAAARGASASAVALIRPFGDALVETLSLRAEDVDLAAWDKALPRTRLTLEADARMAATGVLTGAARAVNSIPGKIDSGQLPLAEASLGFSGAAQHWAFTDIDLRPFGAGRITGSGALQDATGRFDLMLKGIDPARLHGQLQAISVAGRVTVSGDAGAQRLEARLDGAGLELEIAARHADRVLTVDSARLQAEGGRLDFSGRIAFADARAFSVEGKFSQLDPSRFVQAPPARLNGTVSAEGQLAPAWQAQVRLAIAESELRGLPFAASARFSTSEQQPFAGEARAAIGRNRLNVLGRYGQPDDRLRWNVDAADLRALDPALAGSITGQGTFAGTVDAPAVEFSITGRRLAMREFRAASLDVQGAVAAGTEGALRVNAKAAGLQTPYARLDALQLESSGTRARHTLQATLRGHGADASLRAAGGLDGEWRWTGMLEQLEARGPWPLRLTAPASLAFGRALFAIDQLQAAALGGDFGPAGVRAEDGRIATYGAFRGVAADRLLARNAALDIRSLRLGGAWNLVLADVLSGSAEVHREQGDIAVKGDETVAMNLRRLALSLTAADNAIAVAFDADSETTGNASARVQTRIAQRGGQWLLPRDAPLAGNAAIDVRTLAWARVFVPELDRVGGRLAAQASLGGTIAEPRLTGTVNGDGIAVRALVPGLDLRDGRLRAVFNDKLLQINDFYISAGKGKIAAAGTADITGGLRSLDIKASAERAQLLASPELTVVVSGTGRAGLRDRQFALEGRFRVDEGRYDLGTERRPALGEDVIVRMPDTDRAQEPAPLRVRLDVGVDLNDRFAVRGYGLDALLGGSVQIVTRGDALSAVGTVRAVRGEYVAYGQRLTIDRGALIFSGPLDNPGLDLRATRKMQAVQVGVEVGGSLQRPAVKLVSTPDMPDSDRLAWLVLGRDPQSANRAEIALLQAAALGIGSRGGAPLQRQLAEGLGLDELGFSQGDDGTLGVLALGKRITSQLSVRLEQSLGGTAGSLVRIDYMLSERWRLRGTTGAENAGDILFTLRFD